MLFNVEIGEIMMQQNNQQKFMPVEFSSPYYLKQFEFEKSIRKVMYNEGFKSIEDFKGRFCIFDLSKSFWHDLGTLLWFISLLHKLKKQENELQIILPNVNDSKGEKIWDFLIRWRFFKTLSLCVDDPVNLIVPHQLPHLNKEIQYRHKRSKDEFGEDIILFRADS